LCMRRVTPESTWSHAAFCASRAEDVHMQRRACQPQHHQRAATSVLKQKPASSSRVPLCFHFGV